MVKKDSFAHNETVKRYTILKLERKVVCNIPPVVSVSRKNVVFTILK